MQGNYEESRRKGYQTIVSKRGMRAGRAAARKENRTFIESGIHNQLVDMKGEEAVNSAASIGNENDELTPAG